MDSKKPNLWERTKDVAATYTGTFIVVMILNQLLFFGFCLNPICLIAAMPHVLLITVFIGSIINKLGNWGERRIASKTAKVTGEKLDRFGKELNTALQEAEQEIDRQRDELRKEREERQKSTKAELEGLRRSNTRVTKFSNDDLERFKPPHKLRTKFPSELDRLRQEQHEELTRMLEELKEEGTSTPRGSAAQPLSLTKDTIVKAQKSGHFEVFITKSNLANIVGFFDSSSVSLSDFDLLYKTKLNKILSHKEMALLCIYKEVCQNPLIAFERYKESGATKNNSNYVFQSGSKSYHSDPECKLLHGDYFNLELPPEIKIKGDAEIQRFRDFCIANRYLLEESERKFINKLETHFFLKNPPKTITARNSGIERFQNADLRLIEKQIDQLLVNAEQYRHSSIEHEQIIDRLGYGTHSAKEARDPQNPLYTWHNSYKMPLKELMQHYFRVKFNGTLSFDGHLLDKLGFSPCKVCSKI